MTQAEAAQLLELAASGQLSFAAPGSPTYVSPDPGCRTGNNMRSSNVSKPIDPSTFNTNGCGVTTFSIDTTGTSLSGARTWVLGGNIGTGDEEIAEKVYKLTLAAQGLLADLDAADVVGLNSANMNPIDFMTWINHVYNGRNVVFGNLNVKSLSGSSVEAQDLGDIIKFSVNPDSNFAVTSDNVEQDFCDPCFKDDGTRARYSGKFPITGTSGIALDIADATKIQIEACTFLSEQNKNLTPCINSTVVG